MAIKIMRNRNGAKALFPVTYIDFCSNSAYILTYALHKLPPFIAGIKICVTLMDLQ